VLSVSGDATGIMVREEERNRLKHKQTGPVASLRSQGTAYEDEWCNSARMERAV